jgi:hypothetical protein
VKRSRRGGRRPQHNNHNQSGGGGGGGGFNPNRTYDSAGPEVKIRGSASHVYEKYLQLARDANTSGDRVTAENYLQHAEHYYRILAQQQQQMQQYQQQREAQYQANAANGGGTRPPQQGGGEPYQANNGSSAPSFNLSEGNAAAGEEDDADGNKAEEAVPENEGF